MEVDLYLDWRPAPDLLRHGVRHTKRINIDCQRDRSQHRLLLRIATPKHRCLPEYQQKITTVALSELIHLSQKLSLGAGATTHVAEQCVAARYFRRHAPEALRLQHDLAFQRSGEYLIT